ncbi:MAG: hypothetical protein LBU80_03860, partial [Rikenellaceae bacterium]|nr:hypothetical protein [Rikenellaceae bacterium]
MKRYMKWGRWLLTALPLCLFGHGALHAQVFPVESTYYAQQQGSINYVTARVYEYSSSWDLNVRSAAIPRTENGPQTLYFESEYMYTGSYLPGMGSPRYHDLYIEFALSSYGTDITFSVNLDTEFGTGVIYVNIPGTQANAGSITPATQTVASGNSALTLTHTGSSGVNSREWQTSNNGSGWNIVSSATGDTYNPGILINTGSSNITKYYRIRINNTQYSPTATITVTPAQQVTVGSISPTSQTINYGTTSPTLTHSGATGVTNRQWQQSINSGSSWSNISGATGTTYSPGTLYATTYYRVVANGNLYSSPASIVVNEPLRVGYIYPSSQTINPGIAGLTFYHEGSSGVISRQWQQSENGGSWYDITGATMASLAPSALSNTTATTKRFYYRVKINNSVYSPIAWIDVKSLIIPGSISPASQTISAGTAAATLTHTSSIGASNRQWQMKTANSDWAYIPNATGANYSPGILSQTTRYRVSINNGAIYSDEAVVTVNAVVGVVEPASQTVASGQTPAMLYHREYSGIFYLNWQYSADGSNWTDYSSITSGNFPPSAVDNWTSSPQTHYFRVRINGQNLYSTAGTITVNPLNTGSVSPGSQTIVSGESASSLSYSGSPEIAVNHIQWMKRVNEGGWEAITGANTSNYNPGPLSLTGTSSQVISYRVRINQQEIYSAAATVTVMPISPGVITPSVQLIAAGTAASRLTHAESEGVTIRQWLKSTDRTTWSPVGSNVDYLDPGSPTQTTYYKVRVNNREVYSSEAMITVNQSQGGTSPSTSSLTSSENYIAKHVFRQPLTSMPAQIDTAAAISSVTYFDGLGRPKQQIEIAATP